MKEHYIVVSKKDASYNDVIGLFKKYGALIDVDFQGLKNYFCISLDSSLKSDLLSEDIIISVEDATRIIKPLYSQTILVNSDGSNDNWGLLRISQRGTLLENKLPISGTYNFFKTGKNVDIYVVDSGIRLTHIEFENRAEIIYDHYRSSTNINYGLDDSGHGTHVAGIIAGKTYGVAKEANIKVSKIFEGDHSSLVAVISGINACVLHHLQKVELRLNIPSVMNLSLGGPGSSDTERMAIADCIDNGITVVVSAGNDGLDLGADGVEFYPAEIERALTVGSSKINDQEAYYSNYGEIVDVFAPGSSIMSAYYSSDTSGAVMSGTSMAAPHVSGVCALFLEEMTIGKTSNDVKLVNNFIVDQSTKSILNFSPKVSEVTQNRLLFSPYSNKELIDQPEIIDTPNNNNEQKDNTSLTMGIVSGIIFSIIIGGALLWSFL